MPDNYEQMGIFCIFFIPAYLQAQQLESSFGKDTIQLEDVAVRGYEANRRLLETSASINLLSGRDLNQRFGTSTLVSAFNLVPGVRMDERSPGSYRLSIRGSLIRSPFGVRNVKIYWNELPLTDAGGNTYLNALDVRSLGRIEVLKGPAGSLYGAGTGGALLLSSLPITAGQNSTQISALAGSYGQFGHNWVVQTANKNTVLTANYSHLQADGYRRNSAMVRDQTNLVAAFEPNSQQSISVLGFYSDLFYQTPGGLTEAQFLANPRQARPATRTTLGSEQQRAAIYQKIGYLGFSHTYRWSERIQNTTVVFGSLTDFTNPFITNYEKRADQGMGIRTVTRWQLLSKAVPTTLIFGAEWQHNFIVDRTYSNRGGRPDTLQADDELRARQSILFGQFDATLPYGLILTAGLSRNAMYYEFTRFSVRPVNGQQRSFKPVWLPRLALLKKIGDSFSTFASFSMGYSAPTLQEVRPSQGIFNFTLAPEQGMNVEVGARGQVDRLRVDVAAYQFQLQHTIVRRSADNGADYFVNGGRTDQKGLETQLSFDVLTSRSSCVFQRFRIWNNSAWSIYRFRDYNQGGVNVSGKRVPGIPLITTAMGLDIESRIGFYLFATHQFIDRFPLDDTNTVNSSVVKLLNATLGFRKALSRWTIDIYLSGDNILDQTYSLGYDLNALGGRFYNASARRNWTGGLRLGLRWQ